jgi:hypothetical protein
MMLLTAPKNPDRNPAAGGVAPRRASLPAWPAAFSCFHILMRPTYHLSALAKGSDGLRVVA